MGKLFQSTIHQVMWYFWFFTVNPFSLLWSFLFSRKLCFVWSPWVLFVNEPISLDTSGKPASGFFLKITSSSWIILSTSIDGLNSIDWLLKSSRWIFLKFYFIVLKEFWYGKKILEVLWRLYLNINFWILLWTVTSLVTSNVNITVSTTLKYCYK